jgi:hypothetical protein
LVNIIAALTRWDNPCNFMIFVTIGKAFFAPKQSEKERQHVSIVERLTSTTKYFHK